MRRPVGELSGAERLLGEIHDGKHSIPGVLTQIERYFAGEGIYAYPSPTERGAVEEVAQIAAELGALATEWPDQYGVLTGLAARLERLGGQ